MTSWPADARERMIREQLEARGIRDARVLAALRELPRHRFVPPSVASRAYEDHPLPIGFNQTISQPYMTAYMVEQLSPYGLRVLEIGTGSGYGTAVLARMAAEVCSVEIEPELSRNAAVVLGELGLSNVRLRVGDGLQGWLEEAPFARIVLTAAVASVPSALLEQLAPDGWFLGPVGKPQEQKLRRIARAPGGFREEDLIPVAFVEARE